MCLVETDKSPKPFVACAAPVIENLAIITKGPRVFKSRENVLETLLLNQPLDCPICDQGEGNVTYKIKLKFMVLVLVEVLLINEGLKINIAVHHSKQL